MLAFDFVLDEFDLPIAAILRWLLDTIIV